MCTHCGRHKHTRETCYYFVSKTSHNTFTYSAKPEKPKDTGSQEQSLNTDEYQSLKDEITNLRQKLQALEEVTPPSSVGMVPYNSAALAASSSATLTWVIN